MNGEAVSIITSVAMLCLGMLVGPRQSQAAPPTFTLTTHIVYTSTETNGLLEILDFTIPGTLSIGDLKDIGTLMSQANNPESLCYEDIRYQFWLYVFSMTGDSDIDILAISVSVMPIR